MSVFPVRRESGEKEFGRNRTSRPLSWMETLEGLLRRRLRRRWSMDSDNHLFASVSYHQHPTGPTHFPFLESRAAHFPDVPSVPVVKCQYGTYPRTKASLVRQHHRTLPPTPPSSPPYYARARAFKPLWEMTHRGSCRGILRPYIHNVCLREHFNVVYRDGCRREKSEVRSRATVTHGVVWEFI